MKTMFIALVALATSMSASASHTHNAVCPVNCPENVTLKATVPAGYEGKMAAMTSASDDRKSMIRYTKAMQNMLAEVEKQKHLNAIENLVAENAYNNLMAGMLDNMEQQKLDDQLEDLSAGKRFEDMMSILFAETAKK
jgi:hypothetical protein